MAGTLRRVVLWGVAIVAGAGAPWPAALGAQEQGTGTLAGEVTGPDGTPVVDASVHLAGTGLRTITGEAGRFRLAGVSPGEHRVVVQYIGFRPDTTLVRVRADGTAPVAVRMRTEAVVLSGIVVEGQRRGQARALNQQRTAPNIRNVIAQEQIERFPDANIADGLKRVPGVTVSQDYGEARGVMIRGLPAELNSVTIDGERVPANTSGGRDVNLGNILSDMVESIEVHKALTPDMDADAIGGTVNLVTRSPGAEPTFSVSVATGYNELRSNAQTEFGVTYGQRFGRWGVLASGSFLDSYRQEESLHYGWEGALLEDFTLYNYQLDRQRYGASGTLEYEVSPRSRLRVGAMYNRFDDEQYTPKFTHQLGAGEGLSAEGVAAAPTVRSARQRNHSLTVVTLSAGGEHRLGGMEVDYRLAYARGGHDQPLYFNASWRSEGDYAIDLSDRRYPRVTPVNGTDPHQEAGYRLTGFSIEDEEAGDRDLTGALNLALPFRSAGFDGALRVGGKFRAKSAFRVAREEAYRPAEGTVVTLDQYPREGFGNAGFYGDRYEFGPGFDPARLSRYFRENPGRFVGSVDREKVMDEYDAREDVAAGYAMVDATVGPLSVVGGLRYEHTSLGYDANVVQFDEEGAFVGNTPVSQEQSYGEYYPSLHLAYRLGDRTNLRAAASRALARPSYSSLAPYELVLHEDAEIERGNPELKPYRSVNLDLMAEHYLSTLGLLSAGVFYKDLGDVIVDHQYIEESGPYAGYEIVQPRNGSDATLWGWEASWQQQLAFLPGPLAGLGVYANYSFTDSEMEIPGAERRIAIPSQIPHAANLAVLYERHGFSGTLSLHYQAGFIDDVGSGPESDEYFGDRTQLDLSASQQITPGLRLYGEVNNLTDAPYRFYLGRDAQRITPLENAIYGRWGTLGLRYDF